MTVENSTCGCATGRPGGGSSPKACDPLREPSPSYVKPLSFEIVPARSAEQIDAFRSLCREYAQSLPCIAASLSHQGFQDELRLLPGKYAPPAGEILLAVDKASGEAFGAVAMRPLDEPGVCEMKRMFVRPVGRGLGAGSALARAIIDVARQRGYTMMKLDTDRTLTAAIGIYRRLGFRECPPYNTDPCVNTMWFELPLHASTETD